MITSDVYQIISVPGFPTYMAYQSALHRNTNGGNGLQTSTNTLVNNQTQQTTNTNNGTAVPGGQVHLQQVSKSLSKDSMMTIKL